MRKPLSRTTKDILSLMFDFGATYLKNDEELRV